MAHSVFIHNCLQPVYTIYGHGNVHPQLSHVNGRNSEILNLHPLETEFNCLALAFHRGFGRKSGYSVTRFYIQSCNKKPRLSMQIIDAHNIIITSKVHNMVKVIDWTYMYMYTEPKIQNNTHRQEIIHSWLVFNNTHYIHTATTHTQTINPFYSHLGMKGVKVDSECKRLIATNDKHSWHHKSPGHW